MTLQEAARELNRSEKTIYQQFKRTQDSLLKKGIILTRWGPDDYEIEYEESENISYLRERLKQKQIKYYKKKLQELEDKEQGE